MRQTFLLFGFVVSVSAASQSVGINATGAAAHPSAILDVQSNNRGLLIPRLTTAQRQAISSPAAGLMVYDTDLGQVFYYTGSWQAMSAGTGWSLEGNAVTNSNQFLGTTNGSALRFHTNNLLRLTIDLNGNMAVATDQQSLRFAPSTGASNVPMMMMFGSGNLNRDRMVIAHSNSNPRLGLEYRDTNDVFFMRSASTRRFAFELGTGHMGIGVENPQFALDINGQQRFTQTGSSAYPNNGIWFANQENTFNRAFLGMAKRDSTLGIYSPHLEDWVVEFELMREPRIGIGTRKLANVGILPTIVPRAELHVVHTNFGGSNDGVRIQNEGSNGYYWNLYTSNINGDFELYAEGAKRAVINKTSGAYSVVSDARLKRNIQTMEQGTLSKIMKLRPASYQFAPTISDEDGRVYSSNRNFLGFLAQEVEPLFPELVFRGTDNPAQDFLTMDYAGFGVIAIKAIQEQQEQIERLNASSLKQEEEIRYLKKMIEQLLVKLGNPIGEERKN
jgi:hypothetical protein